MRFRPVIFVSLLLASIAQGQVKERTAEPNRLVELRPEKPSAVIVQEPLGLDHRVYNLADGKQVIVFHTGQLTRIVLTVFCNGEVFPEVTQYVIKVVGPTPPDPDPKPTPPSGLPGEIYKQAKAVKMAPSLAKKAAGNFESVSSAIAAGGIRTVKDGMDKIAEINTRFWPRSTEPFVKWVEAYLQKNVTTVKQLQSVFEAITKGLRAV